MLWKETSWLHLLDIEETWWTYTQPQSWKKICVYFLKGCTWGSAQTAHAGWGPALWSYKAECLHGSHSPDLKRRARNRTIITTIIKNALFTEFNIWTFLVNYLISSALIKITPAAFLPWHQAGCDCVKIRCALFWPDSNLMLKVWPPVSNANCKTPR